MIFSAHGNPVVMSLNPITLRAAKHINVDLIVLAALMVFR